MPLRNSEPLRPLGPPTWESGPALLPQVLHRDVAAPEPVDDVIEVSVNALELGAVMMGRVGGSRATEEGKEAMEHEPA